MALDPCVKSILCTLTVPVLVALDNVVQLALLEVNTQLAQVSAALAILNITLVPVNLSIGLAQAVLDQFKTAFKLVPVNLIEGCADLGDFMGDLNGVANDATVELQSLQEDATGLLSFQDELNAIQDTLNENQVTFTAVSGLIKECVLEAV